VKANRAIIPTLVMGLSLTWLPAVLAQAPVAQPRSETVAQRLDRIEQLLKSQGLIELLQQTERLQQEVARLRGDIELQNHNMAQVQSRQQALYSDIDQRLQRLEGGAGIASTGAPGEIPVMQGEVNPPLQTLTPVTGPDQSMMLNSQPNALDGGNLEIETIPSAAVGATATGVTGATGLAPVMTPPAPVGNASLVTGAIVNETPGINTAAPVDGPPVIEGEAVIEADPALVQADYDAAFALLKEGQYEQSIAAFRTFLGKYPTAQFSDNAQYWLGESFYVMRQFENAIAEYERLTNNYPQSQKYTHALLKIGYSYQELGLINEARQYLEMLVKQYPDTTASRLAQTRLQQLALSGNR
jgi:tol-pal system protein YbgF